MIKKRKKSHTSKNNYIDGRVNFLINSKPHNITSQVIKGARKEESRKNCTKLNYFITFFIIYILVGMVLMAQGETFINQY